MGSVGKLLAVAAIVVATGAAVVVGERFAGPAEPVPVTQPTPYAVPGTWSVLGRIDAWAREFNDNTDWTADVVTTAEAFETAWEITARVGPDVSSRAAPEVDFAESAVLWIRAARSSECGGELVVTNVGEREPGRLVVVMGYEFESDECSDDFNPLTYFVEVSLADLSAPPVAVEFGP